MSDNNISLKFKSGLLYFTHEDKLYSLELDNKLCASHPLLKVKTSQRSLQHGKHLRVELSATKKVELQSFAVEARIARGCTMLVNGFQTWTQSRELDPSKRMPPLFPPSRPLLVPYGDYGFTSYSRRRGNFHSWSWAGFNYNGKWLLLASDQEDQGYTLFNSHLDKGRLVIEKDCIGTRVAKHTLLSLYMGSGEEQDLWDEYSSLVPGISPPRISGWTSWYNYYTGITQEIISNNIEALHSTGLPWDVFQIDDGWQQAIGDWQTNDKFPDGMEPLAQKAREKGLKPGLWLAPFICEGKSQLWQQHQDWLLKDSRGKPLKAGWNPGWSGWFYALDFYNPHFQDYLCRVFDRVLNQWGFSMVKLDFLYAAALLPQEGKNRGQVMGEAMDFIRKQCGDNIVLGCGVPLAPATGRVDYCRIGGDVAPYWEDRFLAAINYRERVSTKNSLYSTLHRHMLDKRFFGNDPDVFILRDGKRGINENKLTPAQRHTLFFLNNLLGSLVFLSDDVDSYTPEQAQQLAEMFPWPETTITEFVCDNDLYTITVEGEGRRWLALVNLSDTERFTEIEKGSWFNPATGLVIPEFLVKLAPHQTLCLTEVKTKSKRPQVLGSSGHLLPGAQVAKFAGSDRHWQLKLKPHVAPHSRIWISVPQGMDSLEVNGKEYPASNKMGMAHIIVEGGE